MAIIKLTKNGIVQTRIQNASIIDGKTPMASKALYDAAGVEQADVHANPSAYGKDLLLGIGTNPNGVFIEVEGRRAGARGFEYRSSDAAWEAGDAEAWSAMKGAGL